MDNDLELKMDYNHCVSDMNSSSFQLLGFLKAKWISAFYNNKYKKGNIAEPLNGHLNPEDTKLFEKECWGPFICKFSTNIQNKQRFLGFLRLLCTRKFTKEEIDEFQNIVSEYGRATL